MSTRTADCLDTFLGALRQGTVNLLWPQRCVTCNMPGTLLCDSCARQLPWIDQRFACPHCGAPYGWLTCSECHGEWELRTVVSALTFAGSAARMVTILKDEHELGLVEVIAAAMACALDEASSWTAHDGCSRFDRDSIDGLCFVPATRSAIVRRGFDHMELIAYALSKYFDLPVLDVLVKASAQDQRKLGRQARLDNLKNTVSLIDDVRGCHLLLLDDVITTGASMRACAQALYQAGARCVDACSLARVW